MQSDRLDEIFDRQREFNRRVFQDHRLDLDELSKAGRVEWTKQFVLHVEGELHEFLRETPWKMHQAGGGEVVRSNALEEWVDCFKFLLGLANVWGFTAAEVFEEFGRKSQVVECRYGMERRLRAISPSDPIVGVDVDGVLNDWPTSYLKFARKSLPNDVNAETRADLKASIGAEGYEISKDHYRRSGEKRFQGVKEGAKELLDGIRAAGGTVVLLSRRPYWRFSRIYADTLEWLNSNKLRFDGILFHPEKHRKILDDFPGLVAMVEDDPVVASDVVGIGRRVVLVAGELNRGIDVEGATKVSDLGRALEEVSRILEGSR